MNSRHYEKLIKAIVALRKWTGKNRLFVGAYNWLHIKHENASNEEFEAEMNKYHAPPTYLVKPASADENPGIQ